MKYLFPIIILFVFNGCSPKVQLKKAFQQKDFEKVEILGNKMLEKNPYDYMANFYQGIIYNQMGEYEKAIPKLIKIKNSSDRSLYYVTACEELMMAYYGIGEMKESLFHYNKANARLLKSRKMKFLKEKTHQRIENMYERLTKTANNFGLTEYYSNWLIKETEHIRFHFEDTLALDSLTTFTTVRENALLDISYFFDTELPKKIDCFVWNSKESAKQQIDKGSFSIPEFCIAQTTLEGTVGHELTHSLVYWQKREDSFVKNRFIDEGIAVYFDQTGKNRMEKLKKTNVEKNIDVLQFWKNAKKNKEKIFYQTGAAFVEMLINYDKDKFIKLSANQTYENAESIYGAKIDQLITDFDKEVNR